MSNNSKLTVTSQNSPISNPIRTNNNIYNENNSSNALNPIRSTATLNSNNTLNYSTNQDNNNSRTRANTWNTITSTTSSINSSISNGNTNNLTHSITNNSTKRNRKNLVLSTSFISTSKRGGGGPESANNINNNLDLISPLSPHQLPVNRKSKFNITASTANPTRTLWNIKLQLDQQNQELIDLKRKKDEFEKIKESTSSNIYSGTYSTHHLENHNLRIKANTQIREFDNSIKKIEKNITDLKSQYDIVTKNNPSLLNINLDELSTNNNNNDQLDNTYTNANQDLNYKSLSDLNTPLLSTATTLPLITNSPFYKSPSDADSLNFNQLDSMDDTITNITNNINNVTNNNNNVTNTYISSRYRNNTLNSIEFNSNHSNDTVNNIIPDVSNKDTATWLISTYMHTLQDPSISNKLFLEKANNFVKALKENPEIKNELIVNSFLDTMQSLLLKKDDKFITAAIYRICRYLITSNELIQLLIKLRFDIFIIISLSKENSYQVEREQAIKLLRVFISHNIGINNSIVQSIIACIERNDDTLRNIAIETLLELCFINPEFIRKCHGMRIFENLLQENNSISLACIILDTILELLSTDRTRRYFLKEFNISILSTLFSDSNNNSTSTIDNLHNASILISKALKSYVGCMLYSMDDCKALREVLSFFDVPNCAHFLIDIFLDVLRIKPLHYSKRGRSQEKIFKPVPSAIHKQPLPIIQNVALIILILHNCNFEERLLTSINNKDEKYHDKNSVLIAKARYLLNEYSQLAMNLIDLKLDSFQIYEIDKSVTLFEGTYQFSKTSYLINKGRNTLGLEDISYKNNLKQYSLQTKSNNLIHSIDEMKFRRMLFDSKVLQTKDYSLWNWNVIQELLEGPLTNAHLLEEVVKSTKFIRRLLVFYRPLRLRFSSVSKRAKLAQKYIQVGCKFFHMLTSNIEGRKILMDDNKIIPQLASLLFKAMEGHTKGNLFNSASLKTKIIGGYFKFVGVLTQSNSGCQVLAKWRFFTIIYKMFELKTNMSGKFLMLTIPELDLGHSSHCRTIIGKALVNPHENIRLKATEHIGNELRKLSKENNENVSNGKRIVKDHNQTSLINYIMEMLTRQLYDLNPRVVALADQALYENAISETEPENLISWLRTSLSQMVFIRSPILFELLSTSYGFQLLDEVDFIESERISWIKRKNEEYVNIIEDFLNGSRNDRSNKFERSNRLPLHLYESLAQTEEGISLITSCGDLIRFMNVVKKYVQEGSSNENPRWIVQVKAALWCCGFIGSTELGIGLLDNYSIVEDIIQVAYTATVISVRFTAFHALGLIGKIKEGCEILDEMNWDCTLDVYSKPLSIALPKRFDKFLSFNESQWSNYNPYSNNVIEFDKRYGNVIDDAQPIKVDLDHLLFEKNMLENPWSGPNVDYLLPHESSILNFQKIDLESKPTNIYSRRRSIQPYSSTTSRSESRSILSNVTDEKLNKKDSKGIIALNSSDEKTSEDKIIEKVATIVCELGNHIIANNAIKDITEINNRYGPKLFENSKMFFKVLDLMSKYRFRPHVRKFLFGLFVNKKALENVIKEDKILIEKQKDKEKEKKKNVEEKERLSIENESPAKDDKKEDKTKAKDLIDETIQITSELQANEDSQDSHDS
ncbi:hypothetical protein TBLA_0C05170 [Henningerozyma blattae CBS 6284]|uniref:REM-1 domain-containing protein n=1 Tax=Henningerozyma blattae (strain ATCC 34711 / CBS 6284 / DSM 70876 / NBRC 10599 / NRRL Y-10934 / UCD 77-7) TaxID=1071380 RepID=I2H1R1_HENB6|nr:hypothetical protein TBLA_0C05170 [Tetrapisispora blattae CBS 6284]CCH60313.1 hypothetical protein TBLA_0C05170 [Tetrapisispora blattae CBS 6284]